MGAALSALLLLRQLKNFFFWLVQWLFDKAKVVVQTIFDALPGVPDVQAAQWASYLDVGNAWVPLDLMLLLWSLYYAFWAVFVTTKFLLKLIPGIG